VNTANKPNNLLYKLNDSNLELFIRVTSRSHSRNSECSPVPSQDDYVCDDDDDDDNDNNNYYNNSMLIYVQT
jgi:hypothetical protein